MVEEGLEESWNQLTNNALEKMGFEGYPAEAILKLEQKCQKYLEELLSGVRKAPHLISFHASLTNGVCNDFKNVVKINSGGFNRQESPYIQSYQDAWEFRLKELLTWQGVDEKSQDKMITKWLDGDSTSKPKTLEQFYIYRMYDMREQVEQEILDWKKANAFKPMVARASIPLWER